MIKSLVNLNCFKRLNLEFKTLSHAYLFYSSDRLLNDNIALLFAMKIFCKDSLPCFECEACKKTELNKNPDLLIIDKPAILVEDVDKILDAIEMKPMLFDKKIILIKNFDLANEIAQNKLLKSLEETNLSTIFILTSTDVEKLLPTIKSRLKKIFLSVADFSPILEELEKNNVKREIIESNQFTLTEMIENTNDSSYLKCLENIENLVVNLKTTENIPDVVASLKLDSINKFTYLKILLKLIETSHISPNVFNKRALNIINSYSEKLKIKIKQIIEDSYKKLKSNCNANYVFDNMLYTILKEKYLCKE